MKEPLSTMYAVEFKAASNRYTINNKGPRFQDGTSLREARKECKRLNRELRSS